MRLTIQCSALAYSDDPILACELIQEELYAKAAFSDIKEVNAGVPGEFAFVTGKLTEAGFAKVKESLGDKVLNYIRAEE